MFSEQAGRPCTSNPVAAIGDYRPVLLRYQLLDVLIQVCDRD